MTTHGTFLHGFVLLCFAGRQMDKTMWYKENPGDTGAANDLRPEMSKAVWLRTQNQMCQGRSPGTSVLGTKHSRGKDPEAEMAVAT